MELNPAQREAVEHENGPLLIIAGAGTGKTLVISHRIAGLVTKKGVSPEKILALTFTEKAASEMEERVDLLVPLGAFGYYINTFHAFGERVLRECALVLGLSTGFRVLSRPEQVIFFQDHLFDFDLEYYRPLGNPTRHVESLLALFSRAKDEDITPEEYLVFSEKTAKEAAEHPENRELAEYARQQSELARVYQTYQDLLKKEGYVDFGDLVHLPLQLFRKHPLVLKKFQDRFHHFLVDEFQDTNYSQFQIVRLLSGASRNITVVGDDDQSIYKFRGAAISNILNFMEYFPDARQVVLTENYRSTVPVLEKAYRLIRNNDPHRLEVRNRIDKKLRANRPEVFPVIHMGFDTVSAEAEGIARSIEEKVDSGEYSFRNFALLLRANRDAEPFLRAFNRHRIPFSFSGNRGLYRREEIRILLSFMRLISDPFDGLALHGLASSEVYGIDMETLIHFNRIADRKNIPLEKVLRGLKTETAEPDSFPAGYSLVQRLVQNIQKFRRESGGISTSLLLYNFIRETGYLDKLTREESLESELKIKNIGEFFEKIRRIETVLETDRVYHVTGYLNALIQAGDDPSVAEIETDRDVVNVLTIHKAKGLEFRVVYLAGLVEQKFPTRIRRDPIPLPDELLKDNPAAGDFHILEERRLFYVGITRAQEELYLTTAVDYGSGKPRRPSRFLLETLGPEAEKTRPKISGGLEMIRRSEGTETQHSTPSVHPFENPVLTYYKIDDYLTCPLKYKFAHIIRPPVRRPPAVMYGSALHAAVQAYLRERMAGGRMSPDQTVKIFKESWINDGFMNREHEEKRLKAGKEAIFRFIRDEEKNQILPQFVEKEFKFFSGETKITGRWDRVDRNGDSVLITDYKASQVDSGKKADEKTRKSLQLSIYALAYLRQFGRIPDHVSLYFLDSGIPGMAKRTAKDIQKTEETIQGVASAIRIGNFPGNPSYLACQYCTYNEICPHTGFGKKDLRKE